MVSLGRLSAGLAHELNNPAAAIERSAALLGDRLDAADAAVRLLGPLTLTDEQLAAIEALRVSCMASRIPGGVVTDSAGRTRGCQRRLAGGAQSGRRHRRATGRNGSDARGAGPGCARRQRSPARRGAPMGGRWLLGAGARVRDSRGVDTNRHTRFGDQGIHAHGPGHGRGARRSRIGPGQHRRGPQCEGTIEVRRGDRHGARDLPRVRGFAGELNQIWANLIDNALDAIPESGRVDIIAERERQPVVVRVVDTGPGSTRSSHVGAVQPTRGVWPTVHRPEGSSGLRAKVETSPSRRHWPQKGVVVRSAAFPDSRRTDPARTRPRRSRASSRSLAIPA